jgi:hypothetical protein
MQQQVFVDVDSIRFLSFSFSSRNAEKLAAKFGKLHRLVGTLG